MLFFPLLVVKNCMLSKMLPSTQKIGIFPREFASKCGVKYIFCRDVYYFAWRRLSVHGAALRSHCAIIRRVPWAVAPFVCCLSCELESIGLKLQCRLRRVGERAAN